MLEVLEGPQMNSNMRGILLHVYSFKVFDVKASFELERMST